ncbi:MgtC/SapB family protein [Kitasatospora sp. NPDC008050]|uniref:MgtC/SapB family protein n=1 Tax=Kitasatospora sp. NPDC008050 TaxID=3364021 RepID=UPI0036E4B6AF
MTAMTAGASALLGAGVSEPFGQGWSQFAELGIALLLSCAIGLEREIRQKAAGLRTYTVVGLGAALFTLISKYGFTDVLHVGEVALDPSRMAAQIVSGLGFIGAGVIFVQRGSVRGLTTAATIWLTAAVGSAAAAGLPVLAVSTTAAYFVVCYGLRPLTHRLARLRTLPTVFRITYTGGHGLLRSVLDEFTGAGFAVLEFATLAAGSGDTSSAGLPGSERAEDEGPAIGPIVEVSVAVQGRGDLDELTANLARIPGVLSCNRSSPGDE